MSEDKTELDGMAALAQGVVEQRWPHTIDAQVWAKEFMEHQAKYGPYDEEGMLGWFANAIMAGYDTATMRAREGQIPRAWWDRLRAFLKTQIESCGELSYQEERRWALGEPLQEMDRIERGE